MPTTGSPKKRRPRSSVFVQCALPAAPPARLLRRFALAAGRPGSVVTLRIVGSAESKRLNSRYRGRRRATNVLSFNYQARPLRGDLVLCHPVIASEARSQGKTLAAHYAHLVVHGMLHLRGYDHVRAGDTARMERAEIRILGRLGFTDPYAVR